MELRRIHCGKFIACLTVLAFGSAVLATSGMPGHAATEGNSSHNYHPRRTTTPGRHIGTVSLSSPSDNVGATGSHPGRKTSRSSLDEHSTQVPKSERNREASWDDGLLMSSSGNRKEKKPSDGGGSSDDDDDKKTLSQQVKEGKYGLIQNELYSREAKRPGIISYMANPESPRDNIKNLGGLDEDEIWLAENHVLVLRGGKLPEDDGNKEGNWLPIDDYQAPRRQVKIPSKPKVPPPFPIQLTDGGPIEILSANGKRLRENETQSPYSRDFVSGEGFYPLFSNTSAPFTPTLSFIPVNSSKGTIQFKPIIIPEKISKLDPKSRDEDTPGPFYPALPPGAVIVPPPSNRSDYDDEEDQSIYYPPPYSFVYRVNNSTAIPPGPLVPGIILPPPPDFFSALDGKKPTTIKEKYAKRVGPTTTSRPISTSPRSPHADYFPKKSSSVTTVRKSTSVSINASPETTTRRTKPSSSRPSTFSRYSPKTTLRKPINNATQSYSGKNALFVPRTVLVEVTTPSPVKHTTFKSPSGYEIEPVVGNQVSETSTEKERWTAVISSKAVPLLAAFYATTTSATPVQQQQQQQQQIVETTPATVKESVVTTSKYSSRFPDQASYFFYGEPSNEATSSRTNEESSTVYYKVDEPLAQQQEEQLYNRVEEPPLNPRQQQTAIKLLESLIKDPQVYRAPAPQSNPVSSLYYSTVNAEKPGRNSYVTATPIPQTNSYYQDSRLNYEQKIKPKPIYQYSFESADYQAKHEQLDKKKKKKKQQTEREVSYDYQDEDIIQSVSEPQFEYQNTDSISEQQVQTNRLPYKEERPEYFAVTTARSPIELSSSSTLEPHRAYFTKQDEQLLDDVTKEYFTMFGKKLTGKRAQSTTPIYAKANGVTENPRYNLDAFVQTSRYKSPKVKVRYGGHSGPYSLEGDTLLNYRRPLPLVNPDSEFITVLGPEQPRSAKLVQQPLLSEEYRGHPVLQSENQVRNFGQQRDYGSQRILQQEQQQQQQRSQEFMPMEGPRTLNQRPQYPTKPVSLGSDVNVNYQNPRPPINPDAELIGPIPGQSHREKANSYFAYSLPGDGGHFYFLTPQVSQRQNPGGFLYSPRGSRLVRRRRGPAAV